MKPFLKYKVFFIYEKKYEPIFIYQKKLFQNCNNIQDADFIFIHSMDFFTGKGYLKFKWNKSYTDLIFSKPIIIMYEENILLAKWFNFRFKNKITAVIANNDLNIIRNYFKINNSFTHLMFISYVENHNSSFEKFMNRSFLIQSAIRNINIYGNSRRKKYLKKCIDFFGLNKTANYGKLYHNQNLTENKWLGPLPPSSFFGFAFENSIADFYITEKLFFTYRNDVIPIYRGSIKNVDILKKIGVNPRAFIDASNMTAKQLVEYLDNLIKNRKALYQIYKEPLFHNKETFDRCLFTNLNNILNKISDSLNK